METQRLPLLKDITRCYGDLGREVCADREHCLRFLTLMVDPPELLSYTLTLRMTNYVDCEEQINSKKPCQ